MNVSFNYLINWALKHQNQTLKVIKAPIESIKFKFYALNPLLY
jgi:hypothetical protein